MQLNDGFIVSVHSAFCMATQESYTRDLHDIINRAGQELTQVKYNRCMMHFLHEQMSQIKGVIISTEEIKREDVFDSLKDLRELLSCGEQMIRQHAESFDIQSVSFIDETTSFIEDLCNGLASVLHSIKVKSAIRINVPQECVLEDRAHLMSCLRFIFEETDHLVDGSFRQE